MKIDTMILIGISLILMVGCVSPEADFHKAHNQNSIASYDRFLKKHPDSEFTQQAINRKKELISIREEKARKIDEKTLSKLHSYEEGITTYSEFKTDFRQIIDFMGPRKTPGLIKLLHLESRSSSTSASFSELMQGKNANARVVFGFLRVGGKAVRFIDAPDRFTVVASLEFRNGVLQSIRF